MVIDTLNTIGQLGDGFWPWESTRSPPALSRVSLKPFAREQLDLGYRQVGDAVMTSVTASDVNLEATPATMTLTVCVDTSGIDVLDAAGNSLKASLYNPDARSLTCTAQSLSATRLEDLHSRNPRGSRLPGTV